jgi:GNAT superfamily N-acetyltransferase
VRGCSITKELAVVRGEFNDYERLAGYHYRERKAGPFAGIFALRTKGHLARRSGVKTVGVIVYRMPSMGCELRNAATGGVFAGFDRVTGLSLVNKNVRYISRVIIEPRFRGIGLASRLVRETISEMDVAIVEAIAEMGMVNPFFEKAGMKAYAGKFPTRCARMQEAFSVVGIEKQELGDTANVQRKLEQLEGDEAAFIECEIRYFLEHYGKRRFMSAGLERTGFVLSKLARRPVYYIWFNPEIRLSA